ncbi:MAG TPA: hypothetical protein ENJ35_10785, partial [Gammaproteobacteria bacterium]|nr:hypothetical protein [Gammaproteobacteria bacterium]
ARVGEGAAALRRQSARLPILVGGFLQADNLAVMRNMAQQQIVPLIAQMKAALGKEDEGKDSLNSISKALTGLAQRFKASDSSMISLISEERAAAQKVHQVLAKTGKQIRSQFELLAQLISAPGPKLEQRTDPATVAESGQPGWVGGLAILLAALMLMAGVRVLMRLPRNLSNRVKVLQRKGIITVPGVGEKPQERHAVTVVEVDSDYLDEFITAAKQHVRSLHGIYLHMGKQLRSLSDEGTAGVAGEHLHRLTDLPGEELRDKAEALVKAQKLLQQSSQAARQGSQVLQESLDVMQEVSKSCDQISDAINTVEAIAFEINLLSLNATVEAAHAGDHGNGFAVVASEVRDLAQRSTDSANSIKALIETSIGEVRTSQELITRSSVEIMTVVENTTGAGAAIEQARAGEIDQSEVVESVPGEDRFAAPAVEHLAEFEKSGKALDFHSNQLRGLISDLEHHVKRPEKGRAA